MYVYVCICMYMYVYVCICMYMYVYVCICMYMYVYVRICMYMYVYVCICMYMYVYVCICMYIYICMYMCMYIVFEMTYDSTCKPCRFDWISPIYFSWTFTSLIWVRTFFRCVVRAPHGMIAADCPYEPRNE